MAYGYGGAQGDAVASFNKQAVAAEEAAPNMTLERGKEKRRKKRNEKNRSAYDFCSCSRVWSA